MVSKQNKKYSRYQDYVIKDGVFIGEFEKMYQDFDDPWKQTSSEEWASEKAIALNLLKKYKARKVMELGCGLGYFTNEIFKLGIDVLGVDVSKTAIDKARLNFPDCRFASGDILDYSIYCEYQPDIIVMAEITWYVLDKLDDFFDFLKSNFPNTKLIHLLTTYPDGVQQYGKDKFTSLDQIKSYFNMSYLEWGEVNYVEMGECKRTYFIGEWCS